MTDVGEVFRVFGVAVFGGPEAAEFEALIAQHIEQRIAAPDGAEEIGALGHGRAHEQAAVGAAADGEVLGRGVVVGDEVFGGGDEVVEDVLLVLEHGGLVPGLAVFVAAAQVGQREEAALLHPPGVFGIPAGEHGQIEAAVAGHEQARGAVAGQAFFAGDEHGDAGAVL